MIEFFLITSISLLFIVFFFWIDTYVLSIIPLIFVIIYSIGNLSSLTSRSSHTTTILKNQSLTLSWMVIMIGSMILLIHEGLVRYHILIILYILNAALFYSSYKRDYTEGKSLFSWGMISILAIGVCYAIGTKNYNSIGTILSLGGSVLTGIYHSISLLFPLSGADKETLQHYQEISIYRLGYIILYWIFQPNYNAVIVTNLWFTTLLIAIRQSYLSTKDTLTHKKKEGLSGRALLSGQKVLERYHDNTRNFSVNFFTALIEKGYMPSSFGMIGLQYLQITLIGLLFILTIFQLFTTHNHYTLLRYWLGILCFIITLFGIHNEEKFIRYYKPIALALITGAFYITLADTAYQSRLFTRGSLAWLCINMILCLFHEDLLPASAHILTRHDRIFWLITIIIGGLITIFSLIWLPLSGDLLFALGLIIIGMISFFGYHIWRK